MKILLALAVCLLAGSAAATDLCAGHESPIAADAQVQESDLTREAAAEAAEPLADRIRRDDLEGQALRGVENARKTIARIPTPPAGRTVRGEAFCTWLISGGFRHD